MQISHDELLTGLTLAERAVHEYARFPDQSGVRLVTQGNGLQLIALHAEGGTSVVVSAQIDEPLDVVVPARALLDLVNTAPRGEVIRLRGLPRQRLSVNWARNTATLAGYEPKARYSEPRDDAQPLIAISVDDLRCALQQVSFAASHDQACPLLTGILLEASNDQATFAATNGFHLMMRVVDTDLFAIARASYSGDHIREGRIKKPFLWKGEPYICHSVFGNRKAECVQLVPRGKWQGDVTNKVNGSGYVGVGVAYSKTQYVMTDVLLTVMPEPEAD